MAEPIATPIRQSPEDAWFTGPMLANSAATLPRGHALVESYAFAKFERDTRLYGSLTYLLYGVSDRLTIGAKPFFGLIIGADRTPRAGIGDVTLSAQYRLTSPTASSGGRCTAKFASIIANPPNSPASAMRKISRILLGGLKGTRRVSAAVLQLLTKRRRVRNQAKIGLVAACLPIAEQTDAADERLEGRQAACI
jgi:hypothetical protein